MKKTIFKNLISFAVIFSILIAPAFILGLTASAQNFDTGLNYAGSIGLGNNDPRAIAASIIKIMLGFLGIIAVVIMLLGGFKWMTAGGNEDGVAEAKKLIGAGVVGLVIILASYGLAQFVLTAIINATGA